MKARVVACGLVVVPLALAACASESVVPSHSTEVEGFRSLAGEAAKGFKLPSDVIKVQAFGQYERYQQMFGAARVAGGQISLERGKSGESEVVLGSHYDAIVPSNAVVLSQTDAIAIAQAALPEATSRTAVLMIEPSDGRYYYAVDSRGDALRHAHWVD